MKTLSQSLPFFILLALFISACKGPEGPAGPKGDPGAAGANGEDGDDGNANVLQINYSGKIQTGTTDLFLPLPASLSTESIEKSLFYVFVKQTVTSEDQKDYSYWFPIPGETVTGNEYSFYVFPGSSANFSGLFIRRVVNYVPGEEHFDAVSVFAIPAGSTINARLRTEEYLSYESVVSLMKEFSNTTLE